MFNGPHCLCGVHINTAVTLISVMLMTFFGLACFLFAFLFFVETVPSLSAQNTFVANLLYLSSYSLLFAGVWRRNATLYTPAMLATIISIASNVISVIMLILISEQDFKQGFAKIFVLEPGPIVRWLFIAMFLAFCPINAFFFALIMQGYNWIRQAPVIQQQRTHSTSSMPAYIFQQGRTMNMPLNGYEMVSQVDPSTRCTSSTQFT
ncbi:hypothetical protein M3Y97_00311700 [Aphelenchoides bicaudatus]|nr:hypothetical protein M3Y97_00311700 [Aphelenchoides bicaudatus]